MYAVKFLYYLYAVLYLGVFDYVSHFAKSRRRRRACTAGMVLHIYIYGFIQVQIFLDNYNNNDIVRNSLQVCV